MDNENMQSNFTERIQILMAKYSVSQADIARRTGIDKGSLSLYVNGKYKPKTDKIYLIAHAFGVSPSWLMGLDVPMTAEKKSDELSETKLALIDAVKQMSDEQAEAFLKFLETR